MLSYVKEKSVAKVAGRAVVAGKVSFELTIEKFYNKRIHTTA
jgi:hypothetical protein